MVNNKFFLWYGNMGNMGGETFAQYLPRVTSFIQQETN